MTYLDLFFRSVVASNIPLSNGDAKLPTETVASVILLRAALREAEDKFERRMAAALHDLKSTSYPDFDADADYLVEHKDDNERAAKHEADERELSMQYAAMRKKEAGSECTDTIPTLDHAAFVEICRILDPSGMVQYRTRGRDGKPQTEEVSVPEFLMAVAAHLM